MNILVIGGTRFMGRALTEILIEDKHDITVLSRRAGEYPRGAHPIKAERADGINRLAGKRFDAIFDFIAYDGMGPKQVFDSVKFDIYIMISSTWVTRLAKGTEADRTVTDIDESCTGLFSSLTYRYLIGKRDAEGVVLERYKKTSDAIILRLPIVWGKGDHTKRFLFYLDRIMGCGPLICIDGGLNHAQILWLEDVVRLLGKDFSVLPERPIWEALPDKGMQVRQIIKLISSASGKEVELRDIPSATLKVCLPEYLEAEPLWQEVPLDLTESNLFKRKAVKATAYSEWLTELSGVEAAEAGSELRIKEMDFLRNRC